MAAYQLTEYNWLINDRPASALSSKGLERHFNDLYHLFLNRYARLSEQVSLSEKDAEELRLLLNEIIAIKQSLAEEE